MSATAWMFVAGVLAASIPWAIAWAYERHQRRDWEAFAGRSLKRQKEVLGRVTALNKAIAKEWSP